MINAFRSTAIIVATVAIGGGALAAGAVAVGTATAYDVVATSAHSTVKSEFRPVGYIEGVAQAAKTRDALDIYTTVSCHIADFGSGALAGRAKVNTARLATDGTTAASTLA